jgi:hypothetical protein
MEKQQFLSRIQLSDVQLVHYQDGGFMEIKGRVSNDSPATLCHLFVKVSFFRADGTLVDTESSGDLFSNVKPSAAKSFSNIIHYRGVPSDFTWSYVIDVVLFEKDGVYY